MQRNARKSQIKELCEILRNRAFWDVLPEGYEKTLRGKEEDFYKDLISFVLRGGRVSLEVIQMGIGFTTKGNPSKTILTAVEGLYWASPSREVVQKLIEEPDRTGFHFTCFLGDWFRRKELR